MTEGKPRIAADRLWRDPQMRRQFEKDRGFGPDDWTAGNPRAEDYSEQFRLWAAVQPKK